MVFGRLSRTGRAGVRVDRAVAAAAVTALALSIAIGLRVGADRLAGTYVPSLAGIRLLAPDDQLVTFEDFELGAPGWDGGRIDRSTPAFGGMMGRFGGTEGAEAVSRTYDIAEGAGYAVVTFDLHAIDAWALEEVVIFANGVEVLRQSFSSRSEDSDQTRALIADLPWFRTDLEPAARSGSERGFASGSEAEMDQTLHVRMIFISPPEELRIGFGATLPEAGTQTASWAVDNLEIITTERPPFRR